MKQGRIHNLPTYRRRGITLMELMLAATVTTLTATAGATMIYAVSSTATGTRDYRTQRAGGHYAVDRIARTIRQARAIGYVMNEHVALWLNDANGNDRVDIHELGRFVYDSAKAHIRFEYFTGNEATPSVAAPATVFSDTSVMQTVMDVPEMRAVILAEDVESAVFVGYPDGVESRVVMTEFRMNVNDETLVFHTSASPRAPADYLFFPDTKMPEGNWTPLDTSAKPAGVTRRSVRSGWSGISALKELEAAASTSK